MLGVVVYRMAAPVQHGYMLEVVVYRMAASVQHGYMLELVVYRMAASTAWVHVRGGGVPHDNTYSMGAC